MIDLFFFDNLLKSRDNKMTIELTNCVVSLNYCIINNSYFNRKIIIESFHG